MTRILLTIPVTHRRFTNGIRQVPVSVRTLGEALAELCRRFPELGRELVSGTGELNPYIEVRVNQETLASRDPEYRFADGDEVVLSSIITGG